MYNEKRKEKYRFYYPSPSDSEFKDALLTLTVLVSGVAMVMGVTVSNMGSPL